MVVERIRRLADAALFVVSRPADRFAAIEQPAAVTGLPVVRAEREIDPQLLRSAELGFRNGHVPVTGILSAIAGWPRCSKTGTRSSCPTSGRRPSRRSSTGRPVNHQYSKSAGFEAAFRDVLAGIPAPLPEYFSWLRDRTELWVGQEFAALGPYHGSFRSCNKAFYAERARRLDHWCGECDKCCFIDLILAPFLPAEALRRIFEQAASRWRIRGWPGSSGPCSARAPSRSSASARSASAGPRSCWPRGGTTGRRPPAAGAGRRGGRLAGRAVGRGHRRHAPPRRRRELHPGRVPMNDPRRHSPGLTCPAPGSVSGASAARARPACASCWPSGPNPSSWTTTRTARTCSPPPKAG